MLERYIRRPFFLEKTLNFFSYRSEKKLVNQVINEIFRQMTMTLTLDIPVRPMDAKGLICYLRLYIFFEVWVYNSIKTQKCF